MTRSPRTERTAAAAALALGVVLVLVGRQGTWTTVPAQLTTLGRDVDVPGSVLWEIGLLYALLLAGCLAGVVTSRAGRLRAVAVTGAVLSLLAFSQGLDAGADPTKAVLQSDRGLERLGLDATADRDLVDRLSRAELPTTGWWLLALAGTVLCLAACVVVAARLGRWEQPTGPARGWRD